MHTARLIFRNLVFFRRTHAGLAAGILIATGVLVGALVVGDSMRYSLTHTALRRLGRTVYAVDTGRHFFSSSLADRLETRLRVPVAPMLHSHGLALSRGGENGTAQVNIYGITDAFFRLTSGPYQEGPPSSGEALVNAALAERLALKPGDGLIIRFEKKSAVPPDIPLIRHETETAALRLTVKTVLGSDSMGDFSLRISQISPLNVFVSLKDFSNLFGPDSTANMLLFGDPDNTMDPGRVQSAIAGVWTLRDAGLRLAVLPGRSFYELKSDRLFIDSDVMAAAFSGGNRSTGVLSYLVNRIYAGNRETPYSFVTGISHPFFTEYRDEKGIVINSWLAQDLHVGPGDSLHFAYFVIDENNNLVEKEFGFRIGLVEPVSSGVFDSSLMPDIPGLSETENCRDWDPGFPIDLKKIRKKDEAYWDRYRGTPKAIVSPETARKLWGNRFGDLTAIRFPRSMNDPDSIRVRLMRNLRPESFGFSVRPVQNEALRASAQGVDFGELFLGLSFFVTAGALLLIGLLFVFSIEQRKEEIGLYMASGFSRFMIMKILWTEAFFIALSGSILGSGFGLIITRWVLEALGSVWQGAVRTSGFKMHVRTATLAVGMVSGLVMAVLTFAAALIIMMRRNVIRLQQAPPLPEPVHAARLLRTGVVIFIAGLTGAAVLIMTAGFDAGRRAAGTFMGAGGLVLVSGIGLCLFTMMRVIHLSGFRRIDFWILAMQNSVRRWGRSLTAIGLLGGTIFLVITVGANQNHELDNPENRRSGTGGFDFWAETALPVQHNLNSREAERFLGLPDSLARISQIICCRVHDGDDASCLNLNRISLPRILGLDPVLLHERGAFSFAGLTDQTDPDHAWLSLERDSVQDVIPAIADQTVILWGLGKQVGDTLIVINERGDPVHLKLTAGLENSVFQGNLIISEKSFIDLFPSVAGYRVFLVDASGSGRSALAGYLKQIFRDYGFSIFPAAKRLLLFYEVENTYLTIFMTLGALGLILGSFGMAVLLLRNMLERRGELALLRALGFEYKEVVRIIMIEYGFLLVAGLGTGLAAALIASVPSLITSLTHWPVRSVLIIGFVLLVNGLIWIYAATRIALRGDMLAGLRLE
ncbi:FtsX-like permease family protein [bacterium]|nr:FtsX-like permease family protein [bacterium]